MKQKTKEDLRDWVFLGVIGLLGAAFCSALYSIAVVMIVAVYSNGK